MVRRVDRFNPADRRPEELGFGAAVRIAIFSWVILTSFCPASCSKHEAGQYKEWINAPNFILYNGTPRNGYDHLTLIAYMTGKHPTINHPAAYTWYDELILSTQPIAAPNN